MNKLQGKLVAGLTMVAFFGVLGSAHAQGQYPYAAPAQSPYAAPAQPPMVQAQPPVMEAQPPMVQAQPQWAPPPPMVQAAPPMLPPPPIVAAPNGPNDMTGSLGFGVGVGAGANDLVKPGAHIYMRYWFNDSLSIVPSVQFKLLKRKDIDMQWGVAPSTQLIYCPWKTASTRFAIGGGIGLSFDKWAVKDADGRAELGSQPSLPYPSPQPDGSPTPDTSQPPSNVTVAIYVPISAGVEHFFTRWFSMGVLVTDRLVEYGKNGDQWALTASIDNTKSLAMVGFLFFYTD